MAGEFYYLETFPVQIMKILNKYNSIIIDFKLKFIIHTKVIVELNYLSTTTLRLQREIVLYRLQREESNKNDYTF